MGSLISRPIVSLKSFFRRVRFEFEKNRLLTNPTDISFQLQKGAVFLNKKLLV